MNKATEGDRIPAKLFQVLKDAAVSAALRIPGNLENSAVATGLKKVQFSFQSQEGQCQRLVQTTTQ